MEWVEQGALVPDVVAAFGPALSALEAELDLIASGLDKRFVDAGHSLAHAYDIVEKLIASLDRVTNARIERRLGPRRAGDPDSLISDNRRIKATLPWVPKYADLETIVGHALAWERKLGEIRADG